MDPALLRNIALQTNDKGEADAQIALVSRRVIDRDGRVQLDPDDLPASMRALGGGGAVPMWVKYSATFQQFKDASADPLTDLDVYLPLGDLPPFGAMITAAAIHVTERFDGPGLTDTALTLNLSAASAGGSGPVSPAWLTNNFVSLNTASVTPPENWKEKLKAVSIDMAGVLNYGRDILSGGPTEPLEMKLVATILLDPGTGVIDDLTQGAADFWVLLSVLP